MHATELLKTIRWFNDTRADYPRDRCVHELVELQVARTPDAVAVVHGDASLTYAELDARANQLAHHLRRRGVGVEAIVAIFLERSIDAIVAILGVLKAGAAYLPIDPAYPVPRIRHILADSGAMLLITQDWLVPRLGEPDLPVLALRANAERLAGERTEPPRVDATSRNLAYVIYTSGSTGNPKGVQIEHRGVCNLVTFVIRLFGFTPESRVLQFASMSFDASISEWAGSLVSGATLILSSATRILVGDELAAFIREHRISFLKVPPSVLRTLLAEPFPTLRTLVTAGERCPQELVDQWAEGRTFINCYGPTEATIGATAAVCRKGSVTTTIGRPNANTRIFILDEHRALVPIGEPGEICIAGDGLARGYLNQPGLTAERFIDHPYPEEPDERLYRTGDLGRWLPSGEIEYLGRIDDQVKIRGYRVELGEVEALLARHQDVAECAVIAEPTPSGSYRLVAFVVPKPGSAPVGSELRGFVAAIAPDHLVPATCVLIDGLPLTTNGKVDRAALAALPRDEREPDAVVSRTADEARLAQVWAAVLGCPAQTIRASDSFFDRGGDSLLIAQLVAAIRRELGVHLSVRAAFAAPTLAEQARALRGDPDDSARSPELKPIDRGAALPLSFPQQRLWFLGQLEPGNPFYNICTGHRLRGRLDVERLRSALLALIERHEVLRCRFEDREGRPGLAFSSDPRRCLVLEHLDLAGRSAAELERAIAAEPHRAFELATGPLFRVTSVRLADDDHVLLSSIHHIISDGWSMDVLTRDLAALYNGEPLPPLRIQYADYAAWQQRFLSSSLQPQIAYWNQQLDNLTPLAFPTDHPRPATPRFQGRSLRFRLAGELRDGLHEAARRANATPFMVLVAAFAVLLHRYAGQDDIVFGTPVSGRNAPELDGLVGFFANTLVLRIDVGGAPGFTELVRRARDVLVDAYSNQDVPFEKLVQVLSPQRDQSRNPLFQVMLAYQGVPPAPLALAGLDAEVLPIETASSKFDLTLLLREAADGLEARLEYDTDLFGDDTPRRFAAHFQRLLAEIRRDPDAPIARYDLVTDEDRALVLGRWSWIDADYPRTSGIHQMIEARARAHPERIAVEGPDHALTFAELDRRANQLAHLLLEQELALDAPIAVHLDRSPDVVVCLLAILKVGCAYLPLPDTLPLAQLRDILADSGAPALLTRPAKAEAIGATGVRVIAFDALDTLLDGRPPHPVERATGAERLAYVIYTSGTTGRPKGVCVEHHTLTNLAVWQEQQLAPPHPLRISMYASLGFDMSVQEITYTLSFGHTLVVPREEERLDFQLVRRYIAERELDVLIIPTGLFHQFALDGQIDSVVSTRLRAFIMGGEALKLHPQMRQLYRCFPNAKIINQYGPTETHVVTSHVVDERTWHKTSVPIGVPISNTLVAILDGEQRPAPIGMVGDIHLGGVCVARGYLQRPELTAERFIANPLGDPRAPVLYRTGDLARWLPDGEIQYIGRADTQVKLRGYRIELAEIDAVLVQHPRVKQAVVTLDTSPTGQKALIGYVVTSGEPPTRAELRAFVRERLPDYMVPAAFVRVERFATNQNGKLDRRSLPRAERDDFEAERAYTAPENDREAWLCELWGQLLATSTGLRVGRDDNFFELGGHSLLATQVISRVRKELGIEIPLRTLFEAPTAARFAIRLEAARHEVPAEAHSPERGDDAGPPPLTLAQQRLWFLAQLDPGEPTYHVPVVLELSGELRIDALRAAVDAVVARHEPLRSTIAVRDGEPYQEVHAAAPVPLPVIDAPPAGVDELVRAEVAAPFEVSVGPLLRCRLLRFDDRRHWLLLTTHHVIMDGWSVRLLVHDLAAGYRAALGDGPALPALAYSYTDYARWQRRFLRGAALEPQERYWRRRLAGAPTLDLPLDRPRPPIQTFAGRHRPIRISRQHAERLKAFANAHEATPYMVLLVALAVILHRYSGQDDLMVGSPVAGRTRAEIEPLIGCFTNTLVLRTDLSGDPCFGELVARVRGALLDAYANQDVPFERVVELAGVPRDLSRTPLIQVMFVFQAEAMEAIEVAPGLGAALVPYESHTAKLDLTVYLNETADGLAGSIEYNTDLFEATTIERLAGHLDRVLGFLATAPDAAATRLHAIPLLTDAEQRLLLHGWQGAHRDYPAECVHDRIAAQAARRPEAIAVELDGERLTYGALDARANQLAHHLHALGVGPDVPVAILIERSLEMIIGLVGILKAGGAYVPLDPGYPCERLAFMIEDVRAPVVVTLARHRALVGTARAAVVALDTAVSELARCPTSAPPTHACPEHLAYVIYTSGSTGKPKGAMNSHRAVANRLTWGQEAFGLTEADVVLHKTPLSFDVAGEEWLWALREGARLVLARPGGHQDPAYLADLIERAGVTVCHFVPSMLQAFLEQPALPRLERLRLVVASGEALPAAVVRLFHARLGGELYNLYGPTEAAIEVTWWHCRRDDARDVVPIGRPIANTASYVLDADLQPVAIGVPGELFLGGVQVARGYWNRSVLTAERFVPDPYGPPGARLYRTGDRVRWLADGSLEFLGRVDFQVKLRGFRIELGEIEARLRDAPGVREAVAVLREDRPGDARLVAYVSGDAAAGKLVRFLAQRLPEYMVPSQIVVLDALPLSPNGKLDRRALPAPEHRGRSALVAPRTRTEQELVEVWEAVLQHQPIGVRDDFFELGGHSLLAVRLIAEIQRRFGRTVPLSQLFQATTIEALATALDEGGGPAWTPVVTLRRGTRAPLVLVHPGLGTTFCYRPLADRLDRAQAVHALHARGLEPGELPRSSVEDMARCYLDALDAAQLEPGALGGWSFGGLVAFEMARRLRERGRPTPVIMIDTFLPGMRELEPEDSAVVTGLLARALGLPAVVDRLRDLARPAQLELLAELAESVELLPPGGRAYLGRLVELHAAHERAARAYRPGSLVGPVTLVRASEPLEGLSAPADGDLPAWCAVAPGLRVATAPGDHFTLMTTGIEAVAAIVQHVLDG